ncbi:ABC transporter permease [Clostridium aciditolerans]|uniref:ABC transporter permease subunit n=1 Tax=Clostridium aciditolerans TaxID=339861 RepID=A0A934M4K1_9CLOT|nr:ABC transporter permease subunit [Clostridium aciditolerans]MBI6874110.1 ABC transporter permease subunit [Clostridium aciditolerans]
MKVEKTIVNRKFGFLDIIIFLAIASVLYLAISPGIRGNVSTSGIQVSTDIRNLPMYVLKSVGRMTAAYILSLIFTLVYGYIAAHNEKAEKIMVPVLDILQSIPVLSFLPAVVLGLIAVFPNNNVGLELSCIILIFTGQAWNMTFSFYHSIKILPKDLKEASSVFGLNKWQNFKKLEVPFSIIGLVWNSMMSWAGGWFFLMACEMFTLKGKDFRLPGIGSFLQTAASQGNTRALTWGIAALILVIVLLDQLFWKPVTVWADKFKIELTESNEAPRSFVLTLLRRSVIIEFLLEKIFEPFAEKINNFIDKFVVKLSNREETKGKGIGFTVKWIFRILICGLLLYSGFNAFKLLMQLSKDEWGRILPAVGYSFLRVIAAQIIALIWTVPVGVAIGMNKKIANILQPIIQVVASIPATALFPVILVFFMNELGGLNVASVLLMLMGTQWYILFNVIAGAMAIPEDLKAAAKTFGVTGWKKWKILILPSIFPYLLTGMVTATGGCWNASIVSEYVNFGGRTVSTIGLGALISEATEKGNYPLLLIGTLVMCIVVVGVNKTLWKRLYTLSEEKFKIEL